LRVVAWRQQTQAGLETELANLHVSRSRLLHTWADEHNLRVDDWGETDGSRHAEFVELILPLAQAALAAAVGVLVKEYVDRFGLRRAKGKAAAETVPTPLMAVTIVNERGGTIIFLDRSNEADFRAAYSRVANRSWRGREVATGR
jgi:hypothetical protein